MAGATGWTGRAIAEGVLAADDLVLSSAVSRSSAGQDLGAAWGGKPLGVPVFGSVADALDGVDVLIDYTSDDVVRANTLTALGRGVSVIIGTSGLTSPRSTKQQPTPASVSSRRATSRSLRRWRKPLRCSSPATSPTAR